MIKNMKKTLVIATIAALSISTYAQGVVNLVNTSTTRVSTNSTQNYLGQSLTGGVSGLTQNSTASPAGYIYALLSKSWDGSSALSTATLANVLSGGWTFAASGTNALAGGSIGGGASAATAGSVMPTGANNQFVVVGWSATLLGINTYSAFASALQNSSFASGGFVGISSTGSGLGSASPPETIFGGATGIQSGFTLYSTTPVPEPGTIALASLGALGLLAFRRRNK